MILCHSQPLSSALAATGRQTQRASLEGDVRCVPHRGGGPAGQPGWVLQPEEEGGSRSSRETACAIQISLSGSRSRARICEHNGARAPWRHDAP
ncbi:hypothetical protein AGOR_G00219040 [Albula goreensis]|uniref:Uncharacterized protein n=1 Tax=Albula goreensis TaxID=1534307 RepID=A0A8T3CMY4_9TELE|nr:hypothetical protein AGOR_G00219040 [Albula goreensis]